MSDEEDNSSSEPEEPEGWSLFLDDRPDKKNEADVSPLFYLRKGELNKASKAHWKRLEEFIADKIINNKKLTFSLFEQCQFDYGIWSAEQLRECPDIAEVIAEVGEEAEQSVLNAVSEELLQTIKEHGLNKSGFSGLSSWLSKRAREYDLLADAELFTLREMEKEKLPPELLKYLEIRSKRNAPLNAIKKYLPKLPGVHQGIEALLLGGGLFSEIDSLRCQPSRRPDQQRKMVRLESLWNSIQENLSSMFPEKEVLEALALLKDISSEIEKVCKTKRVDLNALRSKAKESLKDKEKAARRMRRELQLIKSNLNLGAIRSRKKPYNPILQVWPTPCSLEELERVFLSAKKLDRFYPERSVTVLAPGEFDAFYEFDRQSLILPVYDAGNENMQAVRALADFRISIETIKESSAFLDDLSKLQGDEKPFEAFARLYEKWLREGDKGHSTPFSREELNFLIRHVAPGPETLFLRNDRFFIDSTRRAALLASTDPETAEPEKLYELAAQYFATEDFSRSAQIMVRAVKKAPDEAKYDICLAIILLKMKRKNEGLKILAKWYKRENYGFYRLAVQQLVAQALKEQKRK